ncbi:DUF982 domain-containing protein [Rhizobium rhizogenes]|uniref:DUF982 domain-containing protein n=1 Tax=Rhizobium rhizogenes TaxID=359 RepID=A0AA92H711_RHIRH|nr:DUF982 domain-containing protein [Rhizobium rhizogenes]PVE49837.1 DUF982 domain-containing protein [Rhizobium rhizogenes]PVE64712.1 DUF982 domain-containing protein [Agrobacterium tumefaciens]PVE73850.1 DUF982 domain-containing protein [Sphingomonas sp. TPD3009]
MYTKWSKPVLVALEEPGSYVSIETTQAASWAMIEDWPVEDGDALDQALFVCAAVGSGKKKPEDARRAFVAAALEAGLDIKA